MGSGPQLNNVSILVFLDQALKDEIVPVTESALLSFNPCFPGSSAESAKPCAVIRAKRGFNPCFPGSSAESDRSPHHELLILLFQSLFSWIKR